MTYNEYNEPVVMTRNDQPKANTYLYDPSKVFVCPDRQLEEFLFMRGIRYDRLLKGETGWSFWEYKRTAKLNEELKNYRLFLEGKRELRQTWYNTGKDFRE